MTAPAPTRRSLLGLAGGLVALGAAPECFAQGAFPNRPLRLVVPYGAGGAVDTVGRSVAEVMERQLGQQIVIENRVGAGSNIGARSVAKAQPDGYTLLMASPANAINPSLYANMGYEPAELTTIALAAQVPSVLVATPGVPANTVADVVAQAKDPAAATFAHGGAGTSEHLAAELFRQSAKVQFTAAPYRGGAAALPDLMTGRVQYMFSNLLGVLPLIQAKQLKVIAIADDRRSPLLPDTPTFAEAGFPDLMVSVWYGMMAPAGTPKPVIDILAAAALTALKDDGLRARLEQGGARILAQGPDEFDRFLKQESSRWGAVIKAANIRLE